MPVAARHFFSCNASSLDQDLEEEFFGSIRLPNRTFKATYPHRLEDLNTSIINVLDKKGISINNVMDVGVSSGISTYEFHQDLVNFGLGNFEMVATDICLHAFLVDLGAGFHALVDRRANPLQFDVFGRGVRCWTRRRDMVTGTVFVVKVLHGLFKVLSRSSRLQDMVNKAASGHHIGKVTPILLISPLARSEKSIQFEEDDITNTDDRTFQGRFDIVRAANIIQPAYFEKSEMERAIRVLGRRLRGPGSLLAVCRTHSDGANHGTIFEITNQGSFAPVAHVGAGCEIEDLVVRTNIAGHS